MNFFGIVFIASAMLFSPCNDECKKIKNPKPVNSWMSVVLAETYTVKTLQGSIVDSNDKPISDAQIEIIKISEDGEGKVIYVCKTQGSGKFHFKKVKEGKYEIRVSLEGYDKTSVRVTVSKDSHSSEDIVIPMKVSG
jgi:hypothetical protein